MKNVAILRTLIILPLIGIAMPDAAFLFKDFAYHIPTAHIVLCSVLLAIVLTSLLFKQDKDDNSQLLDAK